MAANETPSVGEILSDADDSNYPQASTSRDTIKGWNDRRKSNNQILSTMVPFVQLIGLFDEKEYNKMFRMGKEGNRVSVVFDDDTRPSAAYDEKYKINPSLSYENIKNKYLRGLKIFI